MNLLREGGNEIPGAMAVARDDVAGVVAQARALLPKELVKNLQADIGSAGFRVESGDIDLMIEAVDVIELYNTQDQKDPVKTAKQLLKKHFEQQGVVSSISGRNVHIGVPYISNSGQQRLAQVDVMVIHDAEVVAPWHQHGPRGMYDIPGFKGKEVFILISSLAKFQNLKFDPFSARLTNRDTGQVLARTRKQVAKILLNPRARESDLDSKESILAALSGDPNREAKLAQARLDAAHGLYDLNESAPIGTAAWFRQMTTKLK